MIYLGVREVPSNIKFLHKSEYCVFKFIKKKIEKESII